MYLCPQALAGELNIDDGWMTHEHMASSTWPEEPLRGGRSQPGFYRSILCPEKTPASASQPHQTHPHPPNLSSQALVPRGRLSKCDQEVESIPDTVTSAHDPNSSPLRHRGNPCPELLQVLGHDLTRVSDSHRKK